MLSISDGPSLDQELQGKTWGFLPPWMQGQLVPLSSGMAWPTSCRPYVAGMGACLGLINHQNPRINLEGMECKDMILRMNDCIRRCLAKVLAPVLWTSLQLNINTVSDFHSDSGNRGVSFILGMGSYTGGYLQIGKTELESKKQVAVVRRNSPTCVYTF